MNKENEDDAASAKSMARALPREFPGLGVTVGVGLGVGVSVGDGLGGDIVVSVEVGSGVGVGTRVGVGEGWPQATMSDAPKASMNDKMKTRRMALIVVGQHSSTSEPGSVPR